jgi:hypothetical protein
VNVKGFLQIGHLSSFFPVMFVPFVFLTRWEPSKEKLLKAFHHHSNPLSAANASRSQTVLLLPPPQLVE